MRAAWNDEFCQDLPQGYQESRLLFVYWHQPTEAAAIPTLGLDDIQAFELLNDPSRGHL